MNAGESMRSRKPWHVKGVRAGARHSAHDAARRAGMSVGEWLDSVIHDSAGSDHEFDYHDPYAPPAYRAQRASYDPVTEQVAAINRQLNAHNLDVYEIRPVRNDLETIFLNLMRE